MNEMPIPGTIACQQMVSDRLDVLEARTEHLIEIRDGVKSIEEIVTTWNSVRGFATTIGWIGRGTMWFAGIVGSVGVIWYFVTHGNLPGK